MSFPVSDAHVDVLMRMTDEGLSFYGESACQASAQKLRTGGVHTQVFALYVSPRLDAGTQLDRVLRGIDIFYNQVVQKGEVRAVRAIDELHAAHRDGEIAGILSLEGGGCLRGQASILRILYQLGVRGMGLTWNHANELADGCRELRGGGLTGAGREVIREMERLGMWIDIAHLADAGVADILQMSDGPIMASHANARLIHEHPRNLTDSVLREIFRRKGWVGLTFEGSFVSDAKTASVEGVLRHLDHMLDLGGEDCVGLGSDFDGTSTFIPGLTTAADYLSFGERLVDRYGEALARKILSDNFTRYLALIL